MNGALQTGGTGLEPFSLPTRISGVGHQLIIGPTGSGKSSLLGAMVCNYTGVPNSRIIWLDLDYSSFVLTHLLGDIADYRDVGAPESPPINPMSFLYVPGGLEYLYGWFERLFKRWKEFELSERAFEDFTDALKTAKREGVRNLSGLRALIYSEGSGERDKIRRILQHYIVQWGHIFNAPSHTIDRDDSRVSVYEMRALTAYGDRCSAPAIELMLQSVMFGLDGVSPAWIFIDEAWALLSDEVSAEWLFEAIRMFRRKNAAVILSTQSLTEIVHSPYRGLLLESLPGKIFLPNPEARGKHVASMYLELGLNEHEIAIISSAVSRSQYYYRSVAGSRLFTLALGHMGQAICASTSYSDVQEARRLLREYPNEPFLDVWLRARGLSGASEAKATSRWGAAA